MDHLEALDESDVLIASLASGLTHVEAGEMAGMSAKTVQRRLKDPGFAARVATERTARINELRGQMTGLAGTAIAVLADAMTPSSDAKIRLSAATTVLRHFRDVTDGDAERRIADLEASIERILSSVGHEARP